jgi:predicted Zn-dependent protease
MKEWEARLRRVSAPFAEDSLIFRSNVSLSVEVDNRYYVNSEGTNLATGELRCRLFIQAMTKADDGWNCPCMRATSRARSTDCQTKGSSSPMCAR